MIIRNTGIPSVKIIEPRVFSDSRGYFLETWKQESFALNGLPFTFVQENQSHSRKGVIRGLHYQIQHPQGKLLRVLRGRIFDVAVDLMKSSPTFGQHVCIHLDAKDHQSIWIPPGFAHGFMVLSEEADIVYKCTDIYSPQHECTLRWDDPSLKIPWPLSEIDAPVLSDKDARGLAFSNCAYFD